MFPPAEYKTKQRQAKKRKAEQASMGAASAGEHLLAVFVAQGGALQQSAGLLQQQHSASFCHDEAVADALQVASLPTKAAAKAKQFWSS